MDMPTWEDVPYFPPVTPEGWLIISMIVGSILAALVLWGVYKLVRSFAAYAKMWVTKPAGVHRKAKADISS